MIRRRSLVTSLIAAPIVLRSAALFASPLGFHAYPATRQVGLATGIYSHVLFGSVKFDTSNGYDAVHSVWFPPGGPGMVRISGQVWITGGGGIPGNPEDAQFVVKLVKNNLVDVVTGIGTGNPNLLGTCPLQFSGNAEYNRGDCFFLIVYADAAQPPYPPGYFSALTPGTIDLDANPAHQFWCGECIA